MILKAETALLLVLLLLLLLLLLLFQIKCPIYLFWAHQINYLNSWCLERMATVDRSCTVVLSGSVPLPSWRFVDRIVQCRKAQKSSDTSQIHRVMGPCTHFLT